MLSKVLKYKFFRDLNILIINPDSNFKLDINILKSQGIGGGKTALISLAKSLSKLSKSVTVLGEFENARQNNIVTLNLNENINTKLLSDLAIITTSSNLNLEKVYDIPYESKIKILWVHGIAELKNIDLNYFDAYVFVSGYVKDYFVHKYNFLENKSYIIYNGLSLNDFKWWYYFTRKNPYDFVFASHPIKGLDIFLEVSDYFYKKNPKYRAHIYGGYKLWGQNQPDLNINLPFVIYHGLIPQNLLVKDLFKYSYTIQISDIKEGYSIGLAQCLKAGVIPIISNLGAASEIVINGYNGFLIEHGKDFKDSISKTISIIENLEKNKKYKNYIAKNAMKYNRTWDDVAKEFIMLFNALII
jgi:glycosyltransferase involved in cell wall biosynthesis